MANASGIESKKGGKDQELIHSSTTAAPRYQIEKSQAQSNIVNEGQEVSPFPSGDNKAAMNRRENMTHTRH